MRYFSYNDFMDCAESGEINEIREVEENLEKYELKNDENTNFNNKIIKMLKNKKNFKKFMEEFFNLSEIECIEDISYCSYTRSLNDKHNNNVICKIENKEIFIFTKVIGEIDSNITYKMFENSMKLIKRWNEEEKMKNKRYPIVIPIVIYTGKQKWKHDYSEIHSKINYTKYEKNRINFSYNIIDVNDLEISKLQLMKSYIAKEFVNIKINIYK